MSQSSLKFVVNQQCLDISEAVREHPDLLRKTFLQASISIPLTDDDAKLVVLGQIFHRAVQTQRNRKPIRLHATVAHFRATTPRGDTLEEKVFLIGNARGLTALAAALQDDKKISDQLEKLNDTHLRLLIESTNELTWHTTVEAIAHAVVTEPPPGLKKLQFPRSRKRKQPTGPNTEEAGDNTFDPIGIDLSSLIFENGAEEQPLFLMDNEMGHGL